MDTHLIEMHQENYNLNYGQQENTYSFERICRTCLTERGELQSLFNDRVNEMLMSFTTVQVTINDGLPTNICSQCVLNISRAYSFKQQAEHSDTTLRQYIFQNPQDPVVSNILHLNYEGNNVPGAVEENIISEKCQYFPQVQNLQQTNQKLEDNNKTSVEITKTELCANKNDETFEENMHIENDSADSAIDNVSKTNYCKTCSTSFESKVEYEKHMKTHTKKHTCSECGKSFQYKIGLRTHMRSHGIGEKKHECSHCGKRFYELNDCVVHERAHTGDRPEVCDTCGKRFADPRSLAKHLKIHTGEKLFECDICHKKFTHSYTLTAHKRIHTGEKPFVCNVCGHSCTTSSQLTLHIRTHTQEKPYVCSLCSKAFTSKSGLTNHQMTHTGERKYICSICGKGSRTSSDLNAHLRTHTGEKPYECKIPLCKKRYKTNSQLSAHMRTHTVCVEKEDSYTDEVQIEGAITPFEKYNKLITEAQYLLSDMEFQSYFRLSKSSVEMLIKEIQPVFKPPNPRKRRIPILKPTLLFLWSTIHDEQNEDVEKRFKISRSYIQVVLIEYAKALVLLKAKFIKWPVGKLQKQTIEKFDDDDDFVAIVGALDSIHIPILTTAEPAYYNTNCYQSIILQGICNSDMEFMSVCLRPGGLSTTDSWVQSPIYKKITKDKTLVPENTFLVADLDYESSDILYAFKDEEGLDNEEIIFNSILLKKLKCAKRSFYLLQRNFKRLFSIKYTKIDYIKHIITACCIVHNIWIKQSSNSTGQYLYGGEKPTINNSEEVSLIDYDKEEISAEINEDLEDIEFVNIKSEYSEDFEENTSNIAVKR